MIAQFLLIAALAVVFVYAWSQRGRSRPVAYAMMISTIAGAVLVFDPELSNTLAKAVGVGRGVDLVVYFFMVVTLAAIFNLHLRLRADRQRMTELVRAIAIMKSESPKL